MLSNIQQLEIEHQRLIDKMYEAEDEKELLEIISQIEEVNIKISNLLDNEPKWY